MSENNSKTSKIKEQFNNLEESIKEFISNEQSEQKEVSKIYSEEQDDEQIIVHQDIQNIFSKKFSQFDEIYTQIRNPTLQHANMRILQLKNRKQHKKKKKIHQAIFEKLFLKVDKKTLRPDKLILYIFQFLNIKELISIERVCKQWRNMIKTNQLIFQIVNLLDLQQIHSSSFNKIVERGKFLKKLFLPSYISTSNTACFLICVHKTIQYLQLTNLNIDFANVFIKPMMELETFILENETKRIVGHFKNLPKDKKSSSLQSTNFRSISYIFDYKASKYQQKQLILLNQIKQKGCLELLGCPNLTNQIFVTISKNLDKLRIFKIGGNPQNYNTHLSAIGFKTFHLASFKLESFMTEYCLKIGDEAIKEICICTGESLNEFIIKRNGFEKSAKISDKALEYFQYCPNILRLSIIYSRKFRDKTNIFLSNYFPLLQYLNLRNCPISEPLNSLCQGCPNLREVDISGDSWVRSTTLYGLCSHQALQILHLGHFEHGDQQCDKNLQEYPPKGMLIESIFKKSHNFQSLKTLFLERDCSLTYWLDFRIQKLRPHLIIKYKQDEKLFQEIDQ